MSIYTNKPLYHLEIDVTYEAGEWVGKKLVEQNMVTNTISSIISRLESIIEFLKKKEEE